MARPIRTIALAATAAVLVALAFTGVSLCGPAAAWEGDSPVFAARKPGQSPTRKPGQSPTSVDADGDFRRRCQAPGVVRYFDFDSQEEADPRIYPPSGQKVKRGKIVREIKASGGGSLCFEIPSKTPADTSGSLWLNFKGDLSAQFGQRDEFYVQWRQRFSPEFLKTKYHGGGGWKQVIIGEGDRPGKTVYSCTQLEIVVVNGYHRGIVQMYHSCGGKDGQYEGLEVFDRKVSDIWLLPYNTGKDASQAHATAYTWYDELIISKQRIPDPAVRPSPPAADDNAAAAEVPRENHRAQSLGGT